MGENDHVNEIQEIVIWVKSTAVVQGLCGMQIETLKHCESKNPININNGTPYLALQEKLELMPYHI